jgi:DNA (cytosine-5)-methyltransferase 1
MPGETKRIREFRDGQGPFSYGTAEGPRIIDLFCGCGGMSEGFRQAGFMPAYAVELLQAPAESYRANFGCPVYTGRIE